MLPRSLQLSSISKSAASLHCIQLPCACRHPIESDPNAPRGSGIMRPANMQQLPRSALAEQLQQQRQRNFGFTDAEMMDLLTRGVKPWEAGEQGMEGPGGQNYGGQNPGQFPGQGPVGQNPGQFPGQHMPQQMPQNGAASQAAQSHGTSSAAGTSGGPNAGQNSMLSALQNLHLGSSSTT